MLKFSLLIFLLVSINGFSQIMFEKTYGSSYNETGNCVWQTYDGGYIILSTYTGQSDKVSGNIEIYKTDSLGNIQWKSLFLKQQDLDGFFFSWGNDLLITSDSGFVIVGRTSTLRSPTSSFPLFIKTDKNGNQQWVHTYDSLYSPVFTSGGSIADVIQTSDGDYVLTGSNGTALFIMKTDLIGNIIWVKTDTAMGIVNGSSITEVENHNYLVIGTTQIYPRTQNYSRARYMYLAKFDSIGNELFDKTYSWNAGDYFYGAEAKSNKNGYYFLLGTRYDSLNSNSQMIFISTDTAGNIKWKKDYKIFSVSGGFDFTNDGGFILTGGYVSLSDAEVYLLKTDSTGNMQWDKTMGGADWEGAASVQQTRDNGFAVMGYTYSYGMGEKDIYFIKTNILGEVLTSAPEISSDKFSHIFFPNPAGKNATLLIYYFTGSNETHNVTLNIFDILGKQQGVLYEAKGNTIHLELEGLKNGIYFYKLNMGEKIDFTGKIIIN